MHKKAALIRLIIALIVIVAAIGGIVFLVIKHAQGIAINSTTDLGREVCDAGQKIKNAGSYKVGGNNKMYVGLESTVIQTKPNLTDYDEYQAVAPHTGMLDKNALTVADNLRKLNSISNVSDAALVACLTRNNETNTGKTCEYTSHTLKVYDPHYQLNIYVAKTHKLLKSVAMPSQTLDSFICPSSIYFDPANDRQYLDVQQDKLYDTIKPFVQQS
jgi:hypothetical protein